MILIFENSDPQKFVNRPWVLVGLMMLFTAAFGLEKLNAQNASNTDKDISMSISLSHIEIQEQFIDYKKLSGPAYRETITFGEALGKAFDSTAAHYNYPVAMKLPHFLNTLTFHFAAIDWKSPRKIKYSYHLEGLENEWGNPTSSPMVIYRNLPFGTYTLKAKAVDAAQIWSEPFTYIFSIQRPWWRTWWAYWACVAVLCAIGAGFVFFWQQRKKEVEEMQQLLAAHKEMAFTVGPNRKSISDSSGFLNLVNHTLELHLSDENFGIAELCEILNISRAQLHRKLKKLNNALWYQSFIVYI